MPRGGLYFGPPRAQRALETTDTELIAMAAPEKIGESSRPNSGSSTPAAMGTPSALYRKAKKRFCFTLRMVACDRRIALAIARRSPFTSVSAALSIATSAPPPRVRAVVRERALRLRDQADGFVVP